MESNELQGLLSGLFSNPEIMSKLSGVLGDQKAVETLKNAVPKDKDSSALPLPKQSEESKNRRRLISALVPYLNEDRRAKADKLLGLLSILELSGNANLFNGGK